MHDARRRRRRLSWSADGGGSAYGTAGVLAVEVASRESSRWEGRGKREKEREKERQKEGEGERRARGTGGGGVIYWLDPRSIVSFSPELAAPTPRAPQKLAAVKDRDHLNRGKSLREGEKIRPLGLALYPRVFVRILEEE